MKKLFLLFLLCSLIVSSCGPSWYYSNLISRGSTPPVKTYSISSSDSTLVSTLEFREYAEILKQRLNESGYIETIPSEAALIIFFNYALGDAYIASSSTNSYSYSNTNINTTVNKKSNSNGNTSTYGYGNSIKSTTQGNMTSNTNANSFAYSYGGTSSNTTNYYKIPLIVNITAVYSDSKEPVWEVIVNDKLTRETQLQSVMPWLLLNAKPYFGRSTQGEVTPKIYNTAEMREQYNLVWPY